MKLTALSLASHGLRAHLHKHKDRLETPGHADRRSLLRPSTDRGESQVRGQQAKGQ